MPLLLLLAACATRLPDPVVTGADPDWGYNGERTDVIVRGEHFFPLVELSSGGGDARLDRQFGVRLQGIDGTFDLEGVELRSYESLAAVVPEGLPTGLYDVRVIAPSGATATLADAFTVTDSRADHLAFDLDDVVFDLGTPFVVAFDLLDPEERPVFQALQVTLTLTAPSGLDEVEIDASGLDGALETTMEGGVSLLGFLDEGGHGWVSVTAFVPETLTLEIEAVEGDVRVRGDSVDVAVAPGQLFQVDIDVPYSGFVAVAGAPFPINLRMEDADGNLLEDAEGRLYLTERCGGLFQAVNLVGSAVVEVAVTGATDSACPENAIIARGTTEGTSEPFQVVPDDPSAYEVEVYPPSVEAGTGTLYVFVAAQDAWGNPVRDYGNDVSITLSDDLGGLGSDRGEQTCYGFTDGIQLCRAWPEVAGIGNRIRALGTDRLYGESSPFDVVAGPLRDIQLTLGPTPFTAGEPFELTVTPRDAYGNGIETDPSIDGYRIEGGVGPVDCTWDEVWRTDGTRRFACTATLASTTETITLSVDDLDPDVVVTTPPFVVRNGELASVSFDVETGARVAAGQAFALVLSGADAWGNPYVVQSDPVVDLADTTGSLLPVTATLGEDGSTGVSASVTVAVDGDVIVASQHGLPLGTSAAFDVVPDEAAGLEVALERPWAFVAVPAEVTLRAVDDWGNVVPTYDDSVSVTSASALADAVLLEAWDAGMARGEITFVLPGLADSILAVGSETGLTGSFSPVDVLETECGVTADLWVDGAAETVLCLASGTASATLDASASTGSPVRYAFWDSTGGDARGTDATTTFTWTQPAAVLVEVAAFTADACGDVAQALVYVGLDDGQPTGPVRIVPADAWRTAGSSTAGTTTVDLAASDCSGDVASAASLFVRSDLGAFTSGTTASGSGLVVTLDALGEATVTWSVTSETYGGTATLLAGNALGSAIGSATIRVRGESAQPFVVDLDPRGAATGTTSTVVVRFSEAMLPASFTSTSIRVTDGTGATLPITGITLSIDASIATATLEEPIDLDADTYVIVVSSQVRDTAGNRLDGTWTGTTSSFRASFGAVIDTAPDVSTCTPDTTTFRPDGDDEPGTDEADAVRVEVAADGSPTWWRLVVLDDWGEEVGTWWIAAAGADDEVTWDGTALDGIVVENGAYVVQIAASDDVLDLGEACEVDVTVDNLLSAFP